MKHILQQSHHLVIYSKKEYVVLPQSPYRTIRLHYRTTCDSTDFQEIEVNIHESGVLCSHCGILCKFYYEVGWPLNSLRTTKNRGWTVANLIPIRFFQIILLVMIFGCIIISDCGRMMIWKIQMAVEGSETWKQCLIYWKKFKRKLDTGCGLCPDLEIEGWETNSY